MTDRTTGSAASRPLTATKRVRDVDDAERWLGRTIAFALPLASVVAAMIVGAIASIGSALLVLASGALLGAIALLWASVRTLSGDAPLAVAFEKLAVDEYAIDPLAEEKKRLLRALKDLANEHALGKIDDDDYASFVARYRDEAKEVMREMDTQIAPLRAEAERIANAYLKGRSLRPTTSAPAESGSAEAKPAESAPKAERLVCKKCSASNETDAAFCKQCGSALARTVGEK